MKFSAWWWVVGAVFVFGLVYFLTQIPLRHEDSRLLVDWIQECTVGEAATALFAIIFFASMLGAELSK